MQGFGAMDVEVFRLAEKSNMGGSVLESGEAGVEPEALNTGILDAETPGT